MDIVEIGIPEIPVIFVNTREVNVDDLMQIKPGSIVRCRGPIEECLKVVVGDVHYEHVAGFISDTV